MRRLRFLLHVAIQGKGKIYSPQASRTLLYISQRVAADSNFPFKMGENVKVRIEGQRLIIEKA